MRKLLAALALATFLYACAPALKESPRPASAPEDGSRPNINSVSHYLFGKITQPQDLVLAENMLSLAYYFDPGSPQLKRELLSTRLQIKSQGSDSDPAAHLDLLTQAAQDGILDSEDLANALDFYDKVAYKPGIDWVLAQLDSKYRDPFALLTLCNYRHRQNGITDKKLIKEILQLAPDKEYYSLALAAIHYRKDPQQALELIKKYPNNPGYDPLMLEILIAKNDFNALAAHFDRYSYPEDAGKMQNFISRMRSQGKADIVLAKSDKILATQDKLTIAMLGELAFYTDNAPIIRQISAFLLNSLEEHQADANIAPALIAYAIQNQDESLPLKDLCLRLDNLSSAVNISHLYLYKNLGSFQADTAAAKAEFNRRVKKLIPDPFLADMLCEISYNVSTPTSPVASQRYAYELVGQGKGGKDEINLALAYSHEYLNEAELIAVLERALMLFPQESGYQNDLGYTLLESLPWETKSNFTKTEQQLLQRAELFIKSAYEQDPHSASITDSRLWLHFRKAEYTEALSLWEKLQTEHPDLEYSGELLYHAGMIMLKNGAIAKAKEYLLLIPEGDPFFLLLQEAIQGVR